MRGRMQTGLNDLLRFAQRIARSPEASNRVSHHGRQYVAEFDEHKRIATPVRILCQKGTRRSRTITLEQQVTMMLVSTTCIAALNHALWKSQLRFA